MHASFLWLYAQCVCARPRVPYLFTLKHKERPRGRPRARATLQICHILTLSDDLQTTYRRPAVASPREDRRTRRRVRAGRCAMGPMCPSAPWRHCVARAARAPRRVPGPRNPGPRAARPLRSGTVEERLEDHGSLPSALRPQRATRNAQAGSEPPWAVNAREHIRRLDD